MKTKPSRVIVDEPTVIVRVRRKSACLDRSWPQMIFDKPVGDTRLFAFQPGSGKHPGIGMGTRRFLFPEEHEFGEQRMEWHRALRCFALRQTYLATRPSTTHVDHSVSEIDVMPLQAQVLRYTETCAGGQKRQSAFRLSEVTNDCIGPVQE